MYRYLLFYCDTYYPHGGMKDCVFKTNNFDDLEQFVRQEYEDVCYLSTLSYYDTFEDKTMYAQMQRIMFDGFFERNVFEGWRYPDEFD